MKHRSQPKNGSEPIFVPAGQTLYNSLKTSFVDFRRLMATLEREGHTGYIRLITNDASGLILFREGSALECLYSGADETRRLVLGKEALQQFIDEVDVGHGVLDVVGLAPEVIDGLYQLSGSSPMYTELYAGWVDIKALLKFLSNRKLSGSVMIRAGGGTGVIILADGKFAGAYTSESPDIADLPDKALALCDDPDAMIEVKSGEATEHHPLDVDDIDFRQGSPIGHSAQSSQLSLATAVQVAPTNPVIPITPSEPPTNQIRTIPLWGVTEPGRPSARVVAITSLRRADSRDDFAAIVMELQVMAVDALGNRARKVKDMLATAEPSVAGIEAAIDQIPGMSLLFVDSSRLKHLAQEMRARLKSHL